MKKILVIGSTGAGKSTFSVQLGKKLKIPVIHLDSIFWQPNWTLLSSDKWTEKLIEIMKSDSWIIDGDYGGTLLLRIEEADTIIFLKLSRFLCYWRVFKRRLQPKNRIGAIPGCKEKIDIKKIKQIWKYPSKRVPKIFNALDSFTNQKNIIVLETRKDISKFLNSII